MIKTDTLKLSKKAKKEVSRCATFWYADNCVVNAKKPLFVDSDGDEIVKVTGFNVVIEYEVVK